MNLLAIDSSIGTSVAIVDASGETRAERTSLDRRAHAETIGVLVEGCLQDAGVFASEVTGVVMGVGPGPYTGLRVGMAAAQAFALARAIPLYPVVSHDAEGWWKADSVVVTDARRGEVAYSVYRESSEPRRILGPALCRPEELDEVLGEHQSLLRIFPEHISATGLATVARYVLEHGLTFPGSSPVYLRAPDVTVKS